MALYSLAHLAEDARLTPEEQIAANLRLHGAAAMLSQEQLAAKAGLHPTEISRLERAMREPCLGTIARLACGLGIGAGRRKARRRHPRAVSP